MYPVATEDKAMDALKEAFSFKRGPKSFLAQLISLMFSAVLLLAMGLFLGDGAYKIVLYIMIGLIAGTAIRYVWWRFRPYKEPPPPPVTRYTNPRYLRY
jgi:hypothetical protein